MARVLAPILARLRGSTSAPSRARSHDADETNRRARAKALADAIDRAMHMGLWGQAERIARSASRIGPTSSRLTERLARLRLAQDDAEVALAIIDGCAEMTASLRMLRAACLMQLGRKQEAHADLLRWSKKSASPIDARLMLALLEWEAGDDCAATLTLMRNLKHLEDPRTLELLLLIAVAQDRRDRARFWARRLQEVSVFGIGSPYLNLLCCSLQVPPGRDAAEPTDAQVTMLAMELISAEQVIPSLVEAQRHHPSRGAATLLYRAIKHALDDLTDQARAAEALAKLALLLEEPAAAEHWARKGLERNPMSATLTMLLQHLKLAARPRKRQAHPVARSAAPDRREKAA